MGSNSYRPVPSSPDSLKDANPLHQGDTEQNSQHALFILNNTPAFSFPDPKVPERQGRTSVHARRVAHLSVTAFSLRRFAFGALLALIVLSFIGVSNRVEPSYPDDVQVDYEALILAIDAPPSPNNGTIWFPRNRFPALLPFRPLQRTQTVREFSDACLEQFVAEGTVCWDLKNRWKDSGEKLDFVWSWVNGSDTILGGWRKLASDIIGKRSLEGNKRLPSSWRRQRKRAVPPVAPPPKKLGDEVVRHFREHDELRYSIRSVIDVFPPSVLRNFHLIVGDTPDYSAPETDGEALSTSIENGRLAQIPRWLDLGTAKLSTPPQTFETSELVEPVEETWGVNETGGEEESWKKSGTSGSRPSVGPSDRKRDVDEGPQFIVHPHSEIFKTAAFLEVPHEIKLDKEALLEQDFIETEAWRETVVPSFNSLAIESQLVNIEGLPDNFVYLNDDTFLLRDMVASDFSSPITGPMFRVQRDLRVESVDPNHLTADPDGEWRGLGYTNWLLDQRFGHRARPYLVHEAKTFPVAVLREVQDVFLMELTATAESRFRGKGPSEVTLAFLLVHYVVEKHREALLWSFLVGRSDKDQDGFYSPLERAQILFELGIKNHSTKTGVAHPLRSSLAALSSHFNHVGIDLPRQTGFSFTSQDGYGYFDEDAKRFTARNDWPTFETIPPPYVPGEIPYACFIDHAQCFTTEFFSSLHQKIDVNVIFRRIAFQEKNCGDCIIVKLLGDSGPRGFQAFLPPTSPSLSTPPSSSPTAEAIGIVPTYATANFTSLPHRPDLSPRERAVALISRYSYTFGDSPSLFLAIRNPTELDRNLIKLRRESPSLPAFLALNDDITLNAVTAMEKFVEQFDKTLKTWLEKMWPARTTWEIRGV